MPTESASLESDDRPYNVIRGDTRCAGRVKGEVIGVRVIVVTPAARAAHYRLTAAA